MGQYPPQDCKQRPWEVQLEHGERAEWQPLWDLSDKYEHPYWDSLGEEAIQAGHGGGDFFVMYDFARAVAGEIEPPIDVYDAVTWSSIFPISLENVKRNGEPLDVPDFRSR